MKRTKIVFLYTELASYTIACLQALAKTENNVELHVFHFPVNPIAPFRFDFGNYSNQIFFYNIAETDEESIKQSIYSINPKLIICSGWISKLYLKICRLFCKKCITVLSFDTQRNHSLRQLIGKYYVRSKITPYFKYAFVPGNPQVEFAKAIGFKLHQIISGFYSCDTTLYSSVFSETNKVQKRFVFAGRFVKEKGVSELISSFVYLKSTGNLSDWKLVLIGKGDLVIPENSEIDVIGFLQPSELSEMMMKKSVFVLPSLFEPWGVVVQEFAAAGFPLICSDKVGATDTFLINGQNGYLFQAGNARSLETALLKISGLSIDKLKEMSLLSHRLAMQITPFDWSEKILKMMKS